MSAARRRRRRAVLPVLASIAVHGGILALIWSTPREMLPAPPAVPYVEVSLIQPPPPPPPPPEPAAGQAPAGGAEAGSAAPSPDPEPAPAPAASVPAKPVPQPTPQPVRKPAPTPTPAPVKTPEPERPAPPAPPTPRRVRPTPPSPTVAPLTISAPEPAASFILLGDGALSGALTAGRGGGAGAGSGQGAASGLGQGSGSGTGSGSGSGSGSGVGSGSGQGCDMVQRIQDALRNDARITATIDQAYRTSGASGRAILMWNGDWLQSPGEEGKGLAGVRQAIAVTVGFSPRECKAERVNGYVLLTLSDRPGAPRVALGGGAWRWSDLLSL